MLHAHLLSLIILKIIIVNFIKYVEKHWQIFFNDKGSSIRKVVILWKNWI